MSEERFVFYPTSNYIKDRETDHTYFCNNRRVCILLNELNEKVKEYQSICKVLRKYNIYSAEKLDQVLMNERTW